MSAVAGDISPSTGQIHNAELTDLGTFTGALCFLAGALLLLPERTEDTSPAVTAPAPGALEYGAAGLPAPLPPHGPALDVDALISAVPSITGLAWVFRYRWLNPPDSSLVMDTVTGCLPK